MRKNKVWNGEVQRKTDITRVGWSSRAVCTEVVRTYGENGGL